MLSVKLAIRNVLAHRQRSIILFVVIGLVACVVFLFLSFSDGEMENSRRGIMAFLDPSADVVVYARGLKRAEDEGEDWKWTSSLSIKGYPALLEEIRRLPFVARACTPTTALSLSVFAGGEKYRGFLFRGVDPAQSWLVTDHARMREGTFFDSSDTPQVILHYRTTSTMRSRPGDKVTLLGKDLFGQVIVQEAVLKGLFEPEQDMPYLIDHGYMNMSAYRLVSGFSPDETMSLFVDLKKGEGRADAVAELTRWGARQNLDLEFWDSDDIPKETFGIIELLRLIFMAASILIVALMTFGVMNVVSVNLFDRRREIGTYYCLGCEKGFLVRMYTLEIFLVNLAATVTGVLAGLAVRQLVNSLALKTEVSGLQLLFGGSTFSLGLSAGSIVFIVCSTSVVTICTALTTLGARLRVSPVLALREAE
jgi:ABC-type lipoprotein release transport system permease subunit